MTQKKYDILLIEDDLEDVMLLKRQLKKVDGFEHEITHFTHLTPALEELGRRQFDAIITDMNVPDAHDQDLFNQVKKKAGKTPIIVLSGTMQNRELAANILKGGAQDFFIKANFNGELIVRSILYAQERKQIDTLKDDFISFASHEIKTPITILKSTLSALSDEIVGELNEKQKELTTIAEKNIDRLSRLITNLLDLSRLDSGRLKMNRRKLQLASVVQDVVGNFEGISKEKVIAIKSNIANNAPEVMADEDLIVQVMNNLIGNALRFAKSEITISLEKFQDENGPACKVMISNDGPSLSKEEIDLLFQKFSQIKRPTGGTEYKGTGLGLALCRGILDQHNGKIWAESEEGQGVTFCFTISSAE